MGSFALDPLLGASISMSALPLWKIHGFALGHSGEVHCILIYSIPMKRMGIIQHVTCD